MRFWLVCFLVFLGGAEIVPWVMGSPVPPMVLWAVGVLLAIASNADKLPPHLQFQPRSGNPVLKPTPSQNQAAPQTQSTPRQRPSAELPNFQQPKAPQHSISFTIKKP